MSRPCRESIRGSSDKEGEGGFISKDGSLLLFQLLHKTPFVSLGKQGNECHAIGKFWGLGCRSGPSSIPCNISLRLGSRSCRIPPMCEGETHVALAAAASSREKPSLAAAEALLACGRIRRNGAMRLEGKGDGAGEELRSRPRGLFLRGKTRENTRHPTLLRQPSYSTLRAAHVKHPSSSNSYSRVLLRLPGALTCETFKGCQYQTSFAREVVRAGHNGPCSPCLFDPSRTASGLPLGWKRESARVLPRQHRGMVGQCQPQLDISPGPDKL